MITITLTDGSARDFASPLSVLDIAKSISTSLAKSAIVGEVDGVLVDLSYIIDRNAALKIITSADTASLEVIRHSTAHLLAQAVKQLYPDTKVTIGPVIDNGFYYDFDSVHKFTPEDLPIIEKKMHELANANIAITRSTMSYDEALAFFGNLGEHYKVEIIKSIQASAPHEELSLYTQGDFTDLCRGPHVGSTAKLKAFKLMSIAGAYWRGNSNNPMLQRIYGTAWRSAEELNQYLELLEQAKKRDHRVLGKSLGLFHMQDEAPGMVFWHPNGYQIYQIVEQYIRSELRDSGYQEIKTPQIVDCKLWEYSGHMEMYKELMFTTSSESRDYAVKPMSCPCHVQVFNQGLKSYRDLPLRLAEFGSCHRNEPSGSLHGLMRVRSFTQDDAHIFCTIDQVLDEASKVIDLVFKVYKRFGFENLEICLSTRPDKRSGSDEVWDMAENFLEKALSDQGIKYILQPGEGAFYGPKIEFALKDCLGRLWQCGTLQVDFVLPHRLQASYIGEDGKEHVPVMLHRAILGSLERFIGILIEHYAGAMPLWLAPIQMIVLNISDAQVEYCKDIYKQLLAQGFRCDCDFSNEKIGYKIRNATLQKIPYLLIIGNNELQNATITLRARSGEDLGAMDMDNYIKFIKGNML